MTVAAVPVAMPPSRAAEYPRTTLLLLLCVLMLAPLPLGSNRPLPEALLMLCSFAALFFWSLHALSTGQGLLLGLRKTLFLMLPAALAVLWGLCQIIPLPQPLTHPVWQTAKFGPLSVDPITTFIGTLKLAAYGCLFWLAAQAGRSTRLAKILLSGSALAAGFYAFAALLVFINGNMTVLWFAKTDYLESLTGTFINRNAFAANCGMGLIVTSGLVLQHIRQALDSAPRRAALGYLLHTLRPRTWGLVISGLALVLCLILSTSRAGLASTGFGLLLLWIGLFINGFLPRRALLGMAGIAVAGAALFITIAGLGVMARLTPELLARDERLDIWMATLQMIRDHPFTGQGLGTYDQLFFLYRSEDIARSYTRAHSTYLELGAELGWPAALLFFASFLLIGWRLLRGVRTRRHNAVYPAIGLALLAQAATHSLVDFSFQTPANAAALAILLGVGIAQSWSSVSRAGREQS